MNKSVFLEKLLIGGAPLSDEAREEALRLRAARQQRAPGSSDDFGEAPRRVVVHTRGYNELDVLPHISAGDLVQNVVQSQDEWGVEISIRSQLSKENLGYVLEVIQGLAENGECRSEIWSSAFRRVMELYSGDEKPALSEAEVNQRVIEPIQISQAVTDGALNGLSEWLRYAAKSLGTDEEGEFWSLVDLLLPIAAEEPLNEEREYINQAINRPIGKLAEAVLNRLWHRNLKVGDDIDQELLSRLQTIVDGNAEGYTLGRAIFAAQLNPLFALAPEMTRQSLIGRMNWDEDRREASALWEGFLWSSTFSYDLWRAIKGNFLTVISHANELGMSGENVANVFAYVLTGNPESLSDEQIRRAFNDFDAEGLAYIGKRFRIILEAKGVDKRDVWNNRIAPWIDFWPATQNKITPQTSKALSLLIAVAEGATDDAFERINRRGLLTVVEYPGHIFRKLVETREGLEDGDAGYDTLRNHSVCVAKLLDKVVPQDPQWDADKLREILDILDEQQGINRMREMVNLRNRLA